MSSSREYLDFLSDQLSGIGEVTYRPMMGEYIVYYEGKIVGGIYDDRFLVKPTKSAKALMPNAPAESPYEGAKPMILVEDIDDRDFLKALFFAMVRELPEPGERRKPRSDKEKTKK